MEGKTKKIQKPKKSTRVLAKKEYREIGGYKGKNFDPAKVKKVYSVGKIVPQKKGSFNKLIGAAKKIATSKDLLGKVLLGGTVIGSGLLINKLLELNKKSVIELIEEREFIKDQIPRAARNVFILVKHSLNPKIISEIEEFSKKRRLLLKGFDRYQNCRWAELIKKKVELELDSQLKKLHFLKTLALIALKQTEEASQRTPKFNETYFETGNPVKDALIKNKLLEEIWYLNRSLSELPKFNELQEKQFVIIENVNKVLAEQNDIFIVKEISEKCLAESKQKAKKDPKILKSVLMK